MAPMVTVGIEGSRITAAAPLTAALVSAGATAAQVSGAIATATAHPQWFVPVIDLTEARYAQLKPAIYPVPGTVFQNFSARTAVTAGLAAHVVGAVGPITAQELHHPGPALPGRRHRGTDGDRTGRRAPTGRATRRAHRRRRRRRPTGGDRGPFPVPSRLAGDDDDRPHRAAGGRDGLEPA